MKALQCFTLLLCFCLGILASFDSSRVYLQRDKPGEISNPHVVNGDSVNLDQITSVYWYKVTMGGKFTLLISNYEGSVVPRREYTTKYNITENCALVVNNVSDTDGGKYVSRVVRSEQLLPGRSVDVTVFVSPMEPAPWIAECGSRKDRKEYCTMQLPPDETEYHLTCHVTGARPAVDLHLRRVHADGSSEAIEPVLVRVQREDSPHDGAISRDQALFSTSLFFNGTFHVNTVWLCVATGVAMGMNNGSAMQVHILKMPIIRHVPSTVRLMLTEEVKVKERSRLVLEGISIAVVGAAVILFVAVLWKKTGCRRRFQQAMPIELQPFLTKGPTTGERLASELQSYYMKEMGTIPTHPNDFSVSVKTEDIFVLPGLSRRGNKNGVSEKVTMNRQCSTQEVYLDVPDKEPLGSLDGLVQIMINNQHAVVVGSAGCGKNSLSVKIAHDYAGGKLNSSFKYVFYLRMKEIANSTGVLDAIHRLLPSDTKVSKQNLRNVISNHQKEVLIMVDGAFLLEALAAGTSMPVSDDDISFKNLLSVKGFDRCSVLVTASPHQLQQLQSYYPNYTVVEATGLSAEHSNDYIHKFFSGDGNKADALFKAVKSDACVASLAQSPLALQVLCCIWKTRNALPERVSELYDKVLEAKVNNFEKKYGIGKPQMDSLKEDLGRVAYGGLTDPQAEWFVFSPKAFPATTLENGLRIGVLSKETRTSEGRTVPTVKFLHLFQYYFAAHYLSTRGEPCGEAIQKNKHLLRFMQ